MTNNKTLKTTIPVPEIPYPSHGGNPQAMAELYGSDPEVIIDFSASINPLSPPGCISQLLLETPRLVRAYPDPDCTAVTQKISQATGVLENWIQVSNGSTELIYHLPHLFQRNQEIAILDPCFSEYEKSFSTAGFKTHSIALSPIKDFQITPAELFARLDIIPQLGAFVLGHPASPTGKLYNSLMPHLKEYCEKRNIFLIIDETFIDFSPTNNSAWELLGKNCNLIIIRSLTKFYSIPGLRIGYGILHPDQIRKIKPHQYPWSVNGLAQAIGSEVVFDTSFQKNSMDWIKSENKFMYQALNAIHEIEVYPSEANFFLFRVRDNISNADKGLYQYLLSQSLLIRNCGNFRGLDESFFRISLRERLDNQKLIDAISKYFSSSKLYIK